MAQHDLVANVGVDDDNHEARTQLQDAAEATAVIAAVRAADNHAGSPQQKAFTIAFPPQEAAAQDDKLVKYITELVNRIYFETEASFWTPEFERTNANEIRDYLRNRALALAWRGDSSFEQHGDLRKDLLGCVNVKMFPDEETGEFGMLACNSEARGIGVGRELLRFAEDEARRRGAKHMRLELLQGDGWKHDFKERIEGWYGRKGYQLVRVDDVEKNWASLVPLLAKPMVMKVFAKEL
jgi:GNAT superfamily N-acetyltransferase